MTGSRPIWLTFAPVIFLLLWSSGYVVAKYGLTFIEPFTFLTLRFGCIVAIMGVLFLIMRPPLPRTAMQWLHLIVVGLLLQAMYFGMCYLAFVAGVSVGTLALILALQPIVVGLIAPRWAGEQIGWQRWGGLLLGLTGAVLVIVVRSAIEPPHWLALLYSVLALVGIAAGSLWEKRFGEAHHPVTANLVGYSAGFVGVLPFMVLLEQMHIDWSWEFAAALLYLVVGSSLIGVGLLLAMIRAGDVSRVSALFFLVPPLAALVAWLGLGEIMPPLAWLGMAVAALGVFVATYVPAQSPAVITVEKTEEKTEEKTADKPADRLAERPADAQ